MDVFISYRRRDTAAHAFLLHDRLKRRLGEDHVFLDVAVLEAGVDWRKAIHAHANACGVVIALIGSRWLDILKTADQLSVVEPVDDVAREELELALTNRAGVEVVPVLVDGATMPSADDLPRSLRALADRQAEELRLTSYEQDVERLMDRLELIASEGRRGVVGAAPEPAPVPRIVQPRAGADPRHAHHAQVASLIRGAGHVVVVLGSGINCGRSEPPDSDRLAAALAQRFAYEPEGHLHLAEVAQYVETAWGTPDLYLSLKENLPSGCEPGKVNRFVAALPATLEALGQPRRHQLILTTNYDTALERALGDAGEAFELAIYSAGAGRFVHVPWQEPAQPVVEPNRYHAFAIGDDLELSRTLVVKMQGVLTGGRVEHGGDEDCVITEDNYIDYLSGSPIEEIVPFQILQKLRSSHCLFLGYDIQEWDLRVCLKRVWGRRIRAKSWAVDDRAGEFERALWRECGVELVEQAVDDYIDALSACLVA